MRAVTWAMVLGLGLLASVGGAQVRPDSTMVVVNGMAIKGDQYVRRMQVLPGVGRLVGGNFVQATPGLLTLQQMINEVLIVQLARERNVFPTEAAITAAINARKAENPNLLEGLVSIGMSEDDLRQDVIISLCEFNLTTMGVTVTNQEVDQYYRDHPQRFTVPKRYTLRVIAVTTDAQQRAVDSALSAGRAFGDVAKEFSVDPSRVAGGMMGEVPEADLAGEARNQITRTVKGSTTQWIQGQLARVKFLVEDIQEQQLIALDDAIRAEIRNKLLVDKGTVRNNVDQMLEQKRRTARIEWQGTPFDSELKQLFGPRPQS